MKQNTPKVSGTIDQQSYLSIGRYMLSPLFKLAFIAVIALIDLAFIVLVLFQRDLVWLTFPLILSLGGIAFYRWNSKNVMKRVLASIPGIREGKRFDLDLSFDEDAIRVHNRATKLDTALAYELFGSYAETDTCIALFVKTGTYLLIPTGNCKPEEKVAMLELLKSRCSTLRKRTLL